MPISSLYQFILLRYYKLTLALSSDEGGSKSDSSNGSTCSVQTSIYKKCQNNAKFVLLECILTTWYRHCHHIYYQCKYSMEKGKRGSSKKERNRMVEEERWWLKLGHLFIFLRYHRLALASLSDEGGSKSELLKRRRRSAIITVKAMLKVTNKIILLFHRDLDLKTTLWHSDLSNC